ncbi:hypothetical protein G5C65_13475 [Streptomyces sp. SB3404]|uniref:Uncharacterized protein n=2 Tax=Streptomyces boncukensis TaxID=2711219 RepID=A0A6G4WVT8_9ACTN|nr:hypothetical protein [Streptomyces boncukensis]
MPPVQIHVLDGDDKDDAVGLADVGVVTVNGERHLFLNPQSFGSAVRQVRSALPDLTLEQAERLVRDHCKELKDFDELLSPVDPVPPVDSPLPSATAQAGRPKRRMKRWAVAGALVAALVGSWALGHYVDGPSAPQAETGATDASSTSEASTADKSSSDIGTRPFTDPMFLGFSAGNIACQTMNDFEAECTDADGVVMSTKAAVGPDSTIYTFSYGSERLGLRIFSDRKYAETWARQDGTTELYPHLSRRGRYVLWGTDEGRLERYRGLLKTSPESVSAVHMAGDTGARRAVLLNGPDAVRQEPFTA